MDKGRIKIERSKRSSITMKVLPDETLVVRAPTLLPKFLIDQFIKNNWEWVIKTRTKQKIKQAKKEYVDGTKFLFLGQELTLRTGNFSQLKKNGDDLQIPQVIQFRIEKEIKSWFQKQAENIILETLEKYAKEMNVKYGRVRFSDTQSKWGTCFPDNSLQFNWRLVMAPIFVINYVIVHELAHITEKNHGLRFWRIVRNYNPSYKQQIKWLKLNGDKLKL